jgi:hypothetical protein
MKCTENGGCPFYQTPDRCNRGGEHFSHEAKYEIQ